jgi:tetratricopeptide (TPR) repeat protein
MKKHARRVQMNAKIKGAMFHLGRGPFRRDYDKSPLPFEEESWEKMRDACVEAGLNTVFIDINEGLEYGSHPEIAIEGAWTRQKMRREIRKFRECGITLIPKLNFSAVHDHWLGKYERLLSTPEYYRVCRDLILEVAELFHDAPYFHLGMDEEDMRHANRPSNELVAFRQGALLWHDMNYFLDTVRDTGKTPVIWSSFAVHQYEEFRQKTLGIFHYAFRPDHVARCYRNLGFYYVEKGEWLSALACFERSLAFEPDAKEAISELYYIREKSGMDFRHLSPGTSAIEIP